MSRARSSGRSRRRRSSRSRRREREPEAPTSYRESNRGSRLDQLSDPILKDLLSDLPRDLWEVILATGVETCEDVRQLWPNGSALREELLNSEEFQDEVNLLVVRLVVQCQRAAKRSLEEGAQKIAQERRSSVPKIMTSERPPLPGVPPVQKPATAARGGRWR